MPLDAVPIQLRHIRWQQIALAAWLVVMAGITTRLVQRPGHRDVYGVLATAGRHWLAGVELYWPHQADEGADHFRYSPMAAALMLPFVLLPEQPGTIVWRFFNAGVFLGGVLWWIKWVWPARFNGAQLGILFLLVLPLAAGSLNNGQSNGLVAGLLLAGTAAVAGRRWNIAAVCLVVPIVFKVYPAALAILLAVCFPARLVPRLVLVGGFLMILALFWHTPAYAGRQFQNWVTLLMPHDQTDWPRTWASCDVRLLPEWIGWRVTPRLYAGVELAAAGLVAVRCWFTSPGHGRLPLMFGLAVCWMTVFGPATESCTYILLAPSLAAAVIQEWTDGAFRASSLALTAAVIMFVVHGMALWFPAGSPMRSLALSPLAGLILYAYLMASRAPLASVGCKATGSVRSKSDSSFRGRPHARQSAITV